MRFSEAAKQKVVSTSSATTVGRVDGFVVDPATSKVVALKLKKTPGDADLVRWSELTSFGRDAVTVPGEQVFTTPDGNLARMADKDHDLMGKLVLTRTGVELGTVSDVEFDPADGTVRSVITDRGEIPGSAMTGLGTYALMVRPPS